MTETCFVSKEAMGSARQKRRLLPSTGDGAGCLEDAAHEIITRIPAPPTKKQGRPPRPLFNPDQAEMLMRRLGLDGESPSTLQQAADLKGVSRERVRQLQLELQEWIESSASQPDDSLPAVLLSALELALGTHSLSESLREAGLARGDWSLDRLVQLLHLCGRRDLDRQLASTRAREEAFSLVRDLAAQAVWDESGKSGFAQITAVKDSVRSRAAALGSIGEDLADDSLTQAILSADGVMALPHGYVFGAPYGDPTIVETAKRMLQVSEVLPLRVIRSGLRRRCKFRQVPFRLPLETLRAFFDLHPTFEISDDDLVRARGAPVADDEDTLQQWIVNEIRASDYGMLTRHQVMQRARAARLNTSSVGSYLTYGEQIAHDRRGFFYAVGHPPPDDVVEIALDVAEAIVHDTTQSWHYDAAAGTLTGLIELGDSALAGGVVFADAASIGYLELLLGNRYPIIGDDGNRYGNLSVSEAMRALIGLSTLFAHTFPEPGDLLRLEINLNDRVGHAEVGGSELERSRYVARIDGPFQAHHIAGGGMSKGDH